jgi:hypothetical protein
MCAIDAEYFIFIAILTVVMLSVMAPV